MTTTAIQHTTFPEGLRAVPSEDPCFDDDESVNVVAIDIEDVVHGKDRKIKGSGGKSAKSLDSNHDGRVIVPQNVHCSLSFK